MGVNIVLASSDDKDRIFKFMQNNFYPDDPMSVSVGRFPHTENECPALVALPNNLSLLAVDQNDPSKICGGSVNQVEKLYGVEDVWATLKERNSGTPYGKIIKFLHLNKSNFLDKIRERWPEDKYRDLEFLEIWLLAVGRDYRKQNLACRLIESSIELAREKKYPFVVIECSGAFSAAAAKRLGFTTLYETPYESYKDDQGQVVFNTPHPHKCFTCMIKEL